MQNYNLNTVNSGEERLIVLQLKEFIENKKYGRKGDRLIIF
jgi:hypothetical protein